MTPSVGPYKLLDRIAAGGMGEVYLAVLRRGQAFEKRVALKRLLPHAERDEALRDLFCSEARVSARLNHANIVQVFDFGEDNDEFWLALEFVDGVDAAALIARLNASGEPLDDALALAVIAAACRGLDYAHRLSDDDGRPLHLVHRDLTPSNILVSFEGDVKLADFGLARVDEAVDPLRRRLAGKACYMPPEMARGERVDQRADIYSLGLALYELATGRKAFPPPQTPNADAARAGLCADIVAGRAPYLADPPPADLASDVLAIVRRACAVEVGERYAKAREMLVDLEAALARRRFEGRRGDPGAAVRRLFPERLAARAALERTIIANATTPAEPTEAVAPFASRTPGTTASLAVPRPLPARRMAGIVGGGLLLLAALILGVAHLAAPAPASLHVEAAPDNAMVRIDDGPPSPTPWEGEDLPTDRPIRVRTAAPHHEPADEVVTLAPGERRELRIVLERQRRSVMVETEPPGARARLDGQTLPGVTPLTIPPLPLGEPHTLTLEQDGRVPLEKALLVADPGPEPLRLFYEMPSLLGRLAFDTTPGDARVRLDDRWLGADNTSEPLLRGREYRALVSAAGYEAATLTVAPDAADLTRVAVRLAPWKPTVELRPLSDPLALLRDGRPAAAPLVLRDEAARRSSLIVARGEHGGLSLRLQAEQARGADGAWRARLRLSVGAQPWARVTLDGRAPFDTPRADLLLEPGRHRLSWRMAGQGPEQKLEVRLE